MTQNEAEQSNISKKLFAIKKRKRRGGQGMGSMKKGGKWRRGGKKSRGRKGRHETQN